MKKIILAALLTLSFTGCQNTNMRDDMRDIKEDINEGARDLEDNIQDGINDMDKMLPNENNVDGTNNHPTNQYGLAHFDLWEIPSFCNAMTGRLYPPTI